MNIEGICSTSVAHDLRTAFFHMEGEVSVLSAWIRGHAALKDLQKPRSRIRMRFSRSNDGVVARQAKTGALM